MFGVNIFANVQTAILSRIVRQADNQTIPKVKVTAFGVNNEKIETISGLEGVYTINLPKGDYAIEFYAVRFIKSRFENYKVGDNADLHLDATLYIQAIITGCLLPDKSVSKKKTKNKLLKGKTKNNK